MNRKVQRLMLLAVCILACAGCQEDRNTPLPEPVLHPVMGKVTVQGKPLKEAVITFLQADEAGTTAVAETDEKGEYTLTHMARPGTAAGKYKVVISYLQGKDGTVYGLGPRSGLAKPYGMLSAKERIAAEWSDFGRGSHYVTVNRGGATLDFDLPDPLLPPPEPDPKSASTEASPAK